MIAYQDKTFCTASECSKFGVSCPRSLTDEVKRRAERWWGGPNPPIARFTDPKELACYSPHHETQETETNP